MHKSNSSNTKTFNTTNLVYHLRTRHPEEFSKYKETAAQEKSGATPVASTSRQITLQESIDKLRRWDINDARALVVHRKIGEMIAIDDHPFSVVNDTGFEPQPLLDTIIFVITIWH